MEDERISLSIQDEAPEGNKCDDDDVDYDSNSEHEEVTSSQSGSLILHSLNKSHLRLPKDGDGSQEGTESFTCSEDEDIVKDDESEDENVSENDGNYFEEESEFKRSSRLSYVMKEIVYRDKVAASKHVPKRGSSPTVGFYSGFDDIVGPNTLCGHDHLDCDNADGKDSDVNTLDISSHLKGTLAFGLPKKSSSTSHGFVDLKQLQIKSNAGKGRGVMVYRSSYAIRQKDEKITGKSEMVDKLEKKKIPLDNIQHLIEELQIGYRILYDLMSDSLKTYNAIFVEPITLDKSVNADYLEVIEKPLWLPKIKEDLLKGVYKTIGQLITDIRLMFENVYKYFGPAHSFSRKGLRMELILEQKIALLPRDIKSKCSLEATHGVSPEEYKEINRTKSSRITVNGDNYFSYLLYNVRGHRQAREKELKVKRVELMRKAKLEREKEVADWEEKLLSGPLGGPVKNMWEIPQISQFIFLSSKVLNISEISIYELERVLMIPEASKILCMLMTSLVSSPQQRPKLTEKPFMPYSIWVRKLAHKVYVWYRVFYKEKRDSLKLYEQLGIEPNFWDVCGRKNPFEFRLFHEMTLYQRVWLLKTLCDYVSHNHKSVQEAIAEQPEEKQREIVLGGDSKGFEYIHFPHIDTSDLRIYRRVKIKYNSEVVEQQATAQPQNALFTKEQLRSFRKFIKTLKRRTTRDRDDEWEYGRGSSLKKKKRKTKCFGIKELKQKMPEKRSRPERLRQTPKARYSHNIIDSDNDDYDSYDEEFVGIRKLLRLSLTCSKAKKGSDLVKKKGSDFKKNVAKMNAQEALEPLIPESVQNDESQNVTPKRPRKARIPIHCNTCGKRFSTKSAMYGHTAMHVKRKCKLNEDSELASTSEEVAPSEGGPHSRLTRINVHENKSLINLIEPGNNEMEHTESKLMESHIKEEFKKMSEIKEEMIQFEAVAKIEMNRGHKMEAGVTPITEVKLECDETSVKEELTEKALEENGILNDVCKVIKKELNDDNDQSNLKLSGKINNSVNKANNFVQISGIKNACQASEAHADITSSVAIENNCENTSKAEKRDGGNARRRVQVEEDRSVSEDEAFSCEEPDTATSVPDSKEFELVVASVSELQKLISCFGALPEILSKESDSKNEDEAEKKSEYEDDEEEEKEEEGNKIVEESINIKKPKCEQKLHKALCKLWGNFAPFESKMNTASRQARKRLWIEYNNWKKRDASYIDPAEEAWISDPEPEPVPSTTPTPKPSSPSSSSSEELLYDDGTRKRKLRKRRAKKMASPSSPPSVVPPPIETSDQDGFTVSSRGRVRKVKKIFNYDDLDFEKLVEEAKEVANEEKERRKRKREEENDAETAPGNLNKPSSDVKRYILNDAKKVVGYVGSDGSTHTLNSKKLEPAVNVIDHHTPKLVVSAINENGKPVYVRVFGNQALHLAKLITEAQGQPPKQIKLQRFSQAYTFSTNTNILTHNIPGYPNCDVYNPGILSPSQSKPVKQVQTTTNSITPSSSVKSKFPRILTPKPNSTLQINKPPNAVAVQYQCLRSAFQPSSTSASLTSATKLITATPSVVTSAPPITTSSSKSNLIAKQEQASESSIIVQTEKGQQIRVGFSSERLTQLVQKTGHNIMAIPNGKGGYTLTLVSTANSTEKQLHVPGSSASPSKPIYSTVTGIVRSSVQTSSIALDAKPQQHILTQNSYSLSPQQVVSIPTSSLSRQVIIQNPICQTNPPLVQNQPQQIIHIQPQTTQKVYQVVHSGGRQQLVQMIPSGQLVVSGNNVATLSTMQHQPTSIVVQQQKGTSLIHQTRQVILQPAIQDSTKIIQVAQHNQFIHQPQQVVIQTPPSHSIIVQQAPPETQTIQPLSCITEASKANINSQIYQEPDSTTELNQEHCENKWQSTSFAPESSQQQEHLSFQQLEDLQDPNNRVQILTSSKFSKNENQEIFHPIINPTQTVHLVEELPMQSVPNIQQVIHAPTLHQKEQVAYQAYVQPFQSVQQSKLVLIHTKEGQKVGLQATDGKLTILNSDQLQPLIADGTIKFASLS